MIFHANGNNKKAGVAILISDKMEFKTKCMEFPGGAVVKNPPANARNIASSPSPGRFHMLRRN